MLRLIPRPDYVLDNVIVMIIITRFYLKKDKPVLAWEGPRYCRKKFSSAARVENSSYGIPEEGNVLK